MTASLITIYDRTGNLLTELEAKVEREWLINEYGEATFTLAKTDPHCRESLLRPGNRILIQSNADDASGVDLPDWGGVIDPPQEWGDHDVTVTAYSAEYLFTWRRGPNKITHVDTFGGMYSRIIGYANKPEDLFIRDGDIWTGGPSVERSVELFEMYKGLQGLQEDSGYDWGLEPALDAAGRLYFLANWWEKRGVAARYGLEEGVNIRATTSPLTAQGPIVNEVLAYSSSMSGWNANHVRTRRDLESIAKYGLRMVALSVSCNDGDTATVTKAAEAELKKSKQPANTYELEVVSDLPSGFDAVGEIRLGNSYPLSLSTVGFYSDSEFGTESRVRVIGMRWSDTSQTLELNTEEVTE